MRLRFLLPAVLAVASIAQAQTPSFDDVFIGEAPLDAGGTQAIYTDIYLPTGATAPTPIVVYIHGGSWLTGDHNGIPIPVYRLLESGIAVATIGHRWCNDAIFPAQLHDVKGLVRFLRGKASTYNIDPSRIACWGISSGGYLALLMATTGDVAELEGDVGGNLVYSSRIVAAVDYFGPSDILNMQPDVQTPPGTLFDHDIESSANSQLIGFSGPGEGMGVLRANQDNPLPPYPEKIALARSANPIQYLSLDDPPIFLTHGELDTLVPDLQSQRVFDAATAIGLGTVFKHDPTSGHGSLPNSTYAQSRAFLVRVLFDGPQSTGIPYCFGDGSGAACPCPTPGPSSGFVGCKTSVTPGGKLRASGVASVSNDTLSLVASDMSGSYAFFFGGAAMESNGSGVVLGEGLRCIATPTIRLGTQTAIHGLARHPKTNTAAISALYPVSPGVTRYFQASFRDAQSMCGGGGLNTTNGIAVTYLP